MNVDEEEGQEWVMERANASVWVPWRQNWPKRISMVSLDAFRLLANAQWILEIVRPLYTGMLQNHHDLWPQVGEAALFLASLLQAVTELHHPSSRHSVESRKLWAEHPEDLGAYPAPEKPMNESLGECCPEPNTARAGHNSQAAPDPQLSAMCRRELSSVCRTGQADALLVAIATGEFL